MKKHIVIQILIILLISIATCSVVEKEHIQSDTFFSIAVGNRIVEHGFEEEDQLVWHEGLRYIYLRWGFDVVVNAIYDSFGLDGIQVFVVTLSVLQMLLYYFILNKFTKNKVLSCIGTLLMIVPLKSEFAGRAQLISFLIFIIEYYCIEELMKTNKNRYFWILMILPLLLVNFHTSTYPLYFMFFLPYIAEFILSKFKLKHDEFSKIIIEKRNIKKIIILIIFGIIFGFCSPSGSDAYRYVFSVMDAVSAEFISEMQPINIIDATCIAISICAFVGIIAFTKTKVRVVDCFLVLGITIMSLNTVRYSFFFYLIASISIIRLINDFFKDYKINLDFINPKVKMLFIVFSYIIIIFVSFNNIILNYSKDYITTEDYPVNACEYIKENIDISKMKIFNHFNFGGYLELVGIPVFLDARAEMYAEEFNDTTILTDWYLLTKGEDTYSRIFEKYGITHALIYNTETINVYLKEDENWKIIYQDDVFTLYEKGTIN